MGYHSGQGVPFDHLQAGGGAEGGGMVFDGKS